MPSVGFSDLRGKLVGLRVFQSSDITAEYISWLNDPEVTRYSNQRFIHHTEESCRSYLASFAGSSNGFWSVCRLEDNRPIGTMTAYVAEYHGTVDIGIMIGCRDVWGQGYGQDAWNTAVDWFHFQAGLRKVTAGTMRSNRSMMRLLERSGMTLECVRPRQELLDGTPQDLCYFAKYNEER
ncbi:MULTISPECIES: GNAT family N-acetyltransferase [Rhizobium]|jgi:RimJ/RimL family protein N-acetyltransferase|uniref:GNAT family N-acetyltransferase n=1 Tax=Rhizobium TaxID=379 RepID=UPI0010327B7E|nr:MULTISPECIES: GNAT family N-acetyltransferase [Rhizobium]MDK4736460.1 GNAT family N-acetyltransferase [Rhizobium sp. CNPSo 3490]TAU87485.1 N-acetyltransferase [Rhizobium leguminosarum]TAV52017.1 N-acetyltransferase [Rhizobium leguminosarum]